MTHECEAGMLCDGGDFDFRSLGRDSKQIKDKCYIMKPAARARPMTGDFGEYSLVSNVSLKQSKLCKY